MKFSYLCKVTPLLSVILLITFLSINNQKQYTKLRILIWNTPSLSLGNYIAISSGAGFIISYFITTNLARIKNSKPTKTLKFKEKNKYEEINEYNEKENKPFYDNTLIERDINDPTPTVNANFRIIGRTTKDKINLSSNKNFEYEDSFNIEDQYDEQLDISEIKNEVNTNCNDWNDESYSKW